MGLGRLLEACRVHGFWAWTIARSLQSMSSRALTATRFMSNFDDDDTSLPNKNLDFQFFSAPFQLFRCFKSVRNSILTILVGLTCNLDGSESILLEFYIFAMESLASLESLES